MAKRKLTDPKASKLPKAIKFFYDAHPKQNNVYVSGRKTVNQEIGVYPASAKATYGYVVISMGPQAVDRAVSAIKEHYGLT